MNKKVLVAIVGFFVLFLLPLGSVIVLGLSNYHIRMSALPRPYRPVFPLTSFPPTATPNIIQIPPLTNNDQPKTIQPIPDWIEAVYPSPNSTPSLGDARHICIQPTDRFYFHARDSSNPLISLYLAGEPVRNHLYLEVNGIIPSKLTWEHIRAPGRTNPSSVQIVTGTSDVYCWPVDLTTGLYEIDLYYPTDAGQASYTWYFDVADD